MGKRKKKKPAYPKKHGKFPHVITERDLAPLKSAFTKQLNDERHQQIITEAEEKIS